jgi:hypothetical protein
MKIESSDETKIPNPAPNDESSEGEFDEGPELPQKECTSREFIKYRPKMIPGPVTYNLVLDINESKPAFTGLVKMTFDIANLACNDYLHVDFCGKLIFMDLNGEYVGDEDLLDYMMVFGQGAFFRVPKKFLRPGPNQFIFGFTSWYSKDSTALYKHTFDHPDKGGVFPDP